mgnify:CR=1 FL=1
MADKATTIMFVYTPYGTRDMKYIEIKGIIPDEMAYSYTPQYSAQATLGRMSPIQMYAGGSDIKYGFTLTIHEDMLYNDSVAYSDNNNQRERYANIIAFVDDLKAMAYPYLDESDLLRAPRIYFQIGDTTGFGFVKVNNNWKKPFRRGRFIMVDISFDITAETMFPKVKYITTKEDASGEESYLTYNDSVRLSERESELITSIKTFTGFDLAIGSFITNDAISSEEKRSNIRFTDDTFDYSWIQR